MLKKWTIREADTVIQQNNNFIKAKISGIYSNAHYVYQGVAVATSIIVGGWVGYSMTYYNKQKV